MKKHCIYGSITKYGMYDKFDQKWVGQSPKFIVMLEKSNMCKQSQTRAKWSKWIQVKPNTSLGLEKVIKSPTMMWDIQSLLKSQSWMNIQKIRVLGFVNEMHHGWIVSFCKMNAIDHVINDEWCFRFWIQMAVPWSKSIIGLN